LPTCSIGGMALPEYPRHPWTVHSHEGALTRCAAQPNRVPGASGMAQALLCGQVCLRLSSDPLVGWHRMSRALGEFERIRVLPVSLFAGLLEGLARRVLRCPSTAMARRCVPGIPVLLVIHTRLRAGGRDRGTAGHALCATWGASPPRLGGRGACRARARQRTAVAYCHQDGMRPSAPPRLHTAPLCAGALWPSSPPRSARRTYGTTA
jgi:hypothetical protein